MAKPLPPSVAILMDGPRGALMPRRSIAEEILLAGPVALNGDTSYAWIRSLVGATPRGLDWNTLMTLPARIPRLAERLAAVADYYEYVLPDAPPPQDDDPEPFDPDAETRRAIERLRTLAETYFHAPTRSTIVGGRATLPARTSIAIASTIAYDEHVVAEWEAWLVRMESFSREAARIAERAMAAAAPAPKRGAPDDAAVSEAKRVADDPTT